MKQICLQMLCLRNLRRQSLDPGPPGLLAALQAEKGKVKKQETVTAVHRSGP